MKQSYSFSEFSTALQCLRKYKLLILDKIQVPGLESGDMSFGTGIHAGVNALLKGEDGEEVFEIYWASERERNLEYSRFNHSDLGVIGVKMLAKFKRLHLPKFKFVFGEERLFGAYNGINLEGTPDCVAEYDGKLTLFDFKTTGYNYAKGKVDVSLQLMLYAYLYQQKTGTWVEQIAYLPFVKATAAIQGPLIKAITPGEVDDALRGMSEYIAMFQTQTTYPKNPNSCFMGALECPYYATCWQSLYQTMGE